MRPTYLATLAVLGLAGAASAQDSRPAARPVAPMTAAPRTIARPPENAEARAREDARQKRWDDRMRRATRSLCNGC